MFRHRALDERCIFGNLGYTLWVWVKSVNEQGKSENVLKWKTKDGMFRGKIMQKALEEEKLEVTEIQKDEKKAE